MNPEPHRDHLDRLHHEALLRAQALRRQALDAFWCDLGRALRGAVDGAARLVKPTRGSPGRDCRPPARPEGHRA